MTRRWNDFTVAPRRRKVVAPKTGDDLAAEDDAISRYLAENAVTRCPARWAALADDGYFDSEAPAQATVSVADTEADAEDAATSPPAKKKPARLRAKRAGLMEGPQHLPEPRTLEGNTADDFTRTP